MTQNHKGDTPRKKQFDDTTDYEDETRKIFGRTVVISTPVKMPEYIPEFIRRQIEEEEEERRRPPGLFL